MSENDLFFKPATELADLVRLGEVSARELAELSLDRIEADEQGLNAFTVVDRGGALAVADGIVPGDERPFAGVPIAIKDLSLATAGLRVSSGSDLYGDYTPDYDAHTVRRIREAGFVIVGKTAAPEMGIVPVTEPRRFGPTRNPWNTDHTPGGSSGGSAAAVAGGLVPIAHASDGGGSIRIPAACCGLVGLKVSRGRISRGPDQGESFLSVDGVLTRTVADTAATLDLLAGYERGDANWAPPPFEPFAETAARSPGPLRVALVLDPGMDVSLDPQAERAARDAAALLESLGHQVVEADAPVQFEQMIEMFTDLWAAMVSLGVMFGELVSGQTATDENIEPLTMALHQRALETGSSSYLRSMTLLQRVARGAVEWSSQWDLVLTPALAKRPLLVGELDTCAPEPMDTFHASSDFTPFTPFVNVTGQPAISLPMYEGDDGLPLAAHLIGPPLGEGLLLSVAAQLEAEQRWDDRRPSGAALRS
ncbi:MAG TPA: amidase [Thermoleophilaceae bacterium]|nr:amidase [Thermoleophilaceae bacterium]